MQEVRREHRGASLSWGWGVSRPANVPLSEVGLDARLAAPHRWKLGWEQMAVASSLRLRLDGARTRNLAAGYGRGDGVEHLYDPRPESESEEARNEALKELICSYTWPCSEAFAVVYGPTPACPNGESGGNWAAYNAGNYGGFQVNAVHAWRVGGDLQSLFISAVNIRVAHDIYVDNAGWGPWACSPRGAFVP